MSVMMELNAKGPFVWDWENLVMFSSNGSEAPKSSQVVDSDIEGIEGFEVVSFYSSGGHSDGGTGSDLEYASSKSSKSTSVDSSTDRDLRGTHSLVDNYNNNNISGVTWTSLTDESSAASGESLIALELGKRTYFEDVSGGSTVRNTSTLPSDPGSKKQKSACLSSESPRCQVEGCNLDLSSGKVYHRKHRVCENHSKSPKVVINGVERRFCQQCSRFHGLSEFDLKKRSCRRRLTDHNARRRKPRPEVIQFNTMRLTPSLYEGGNQLNLAINQVSMLQNGHSTFDGAKDSKITLEQPGIFNTIKPGVLDVVHSTHIRLQNPAIKASHVSAQLTPSKGVASHVYQQGLPLSVAPSNLAATQGFRALSLLSTSLWGPCDLEPSIPHHYVHRKDASMTQPLPTMDVVPLGDGQPIVSDLWHSDHQQASSGHDSQTPAFQLFKPNESNFYLC